MNLQKKLFASSFAADVYEKTNNARMFLTRNVLQPESGEREWFQKGVTLSLGMELAHRYQEQKADDCYMSTHGFGWDKGTGRSTSSVNQLTGFYVDFDYYDSEYAHLSVTELCDLVLSENPWIPHPTMVMSSGKGCWMFWKFQRVVHLTENTAKWNYLAQWQTSQTFLVSQLKKYGADPKCCDAARVVRLPETINSKTGNKAEAWETGQTYKFGDIKKAISARYRELNPKHDLLPSDSKSETKTKGKHQKVSYIFSLYSLTWARMQDLKTLAHLRGGRFSEHRRMAAYVYAVAASKYCKTEHSLRTEVDSFISGYLTNPLTQLRTINYESTVKRFRNHHELKAQGKTDKQINSELDPSKNLYRNSTKYIVNVLAITPAEQRKMKTLIGVDEKRSRNTINKRQKRREAGVLPRDEYNDHRQRAKAEKASEALRLRQNGYSMGDIGIMMGVSKATVHTWLSEG